PLEALATVIPRRLGLDTALRQPGLLAQTAERVPEGGLAGVQRQLAAGQLAIVGEIDGVAALAGQLGHGLGDGGVLEVQADALGVEQGGAGLLILQLADDQPEAVTQLTIAARRAQGLTQRWQRGGPKGLQLPCRLLALGELRAA